jgi:DNA/RNA endonuclease YhcR with UshA esterase domain
MKFPMKCVFIVLAILTGLNLAQAADTNAPVLAKISATNADKHYGEKVIVTGKVVEVTVRPKVVILNFEQPFPNSPFTGVIFNRSTNQFGDLLSLKGKNAEVSGVIQKYQNKPEIILTNANQLTIAKTPTAP